jgi:CDP-diacylglycerol--glycerol-3-phosphate 3-phosphatidyltransferase
MPSRTRITFTDRLLGDTVLKLVPKNISPNQITVARMILTPFVGAVLFLEYYYVGFALFALTALTDALDGARARLDSRITRFGEFWDPVADKFLVGMVVCIMLPRLAGLPILLIVILGEIAPLLALYAASKKKGLENLDVSANIWGKLKMIAQCIALLAILADSAFGVPIFVPAGFYLFTISVLLSLISTHLHYRNWIKA